MNNKPDFLAQFLDDNGKNIDMIGTSVAQLKRKLSKLPYTIGSASICEKQPDGSYKLSWYKPQYHNRKTKRHG